VLTSGGLDEVVYIDTKSVADDVVNSGAGEAAEFSGMSAEYVNLLQLVATPAVVRQTVTTVHDRRRRIVGVDDFEPNCIVETKIKSFK